jgi:hypothetical protein
MGLQSRAADGGGERLPRVVTPLGLKKVKNPHPFANIATRVGRPFIRAVSADVRVPESGG